jgi:hypothetical protein
MAFLLRGQLLIVAPFSPCKFIIVRMHTTHVNFPS